MKPERILLFLLLLLGASLACQRFGLASPASQPTYTPPPTHTVVPTSTPPPSEFTIQFHMFSDLLYDSAFLKIENTGTTALEPQALQLRNSDTSEIYVEIEGPQFGDESRSLLSGETKIIEVELGYHDEVGTRYVASLTLCDEDGRCLTKESGIFEYRQNLDFELNFLESNLCEEEVPYAVFEVTNSGNWLLQHANILLERVDDGAVVAKYATDEPYVFGECPRAWGDSSSILKYSSDSSVARFLAQERILVAGESKNIVVELGQLDPGAELQATIDLCTWDDECVSKMVQFTYLGEPSFDAAYMGRHPCEEAPNAASFAVTNTGLRAFRSSQIDIQVEDGEEISSSIGNTGFVAAEDACPPGDSDLSPAETAYLSADIGGTELGPQFQATIKMCTEEDLEGRCPSQTLSFVENLTFDLRFAGTHLCTEQSVFERTYAAFEITNTSNWPFESKFVKVFDLANDERVHEPFTPDEALKRNNAPFVGEEGCYPGNAVLESGETSYIIYALYAAEPGDYAANVQLCTQDDVKGACMEKKIDFSYGE
jgi:hypothetical protein